MFLVPNANEAVTQGDLIDDCPLVGLDTRESVQDVGKYPVNRWSARVIVLTQACDLAQGKVSRALVAPVYDAQKLVATGMLKGTVVRDQIRRHLVFGWYFLPATVTPFDLPESLIDLRDLHSVPSRVLDQLTGDGKRIARLMPPYREHLAQHFAVTYMRVALPEPFSTQP